MDDLKNRIAREKLHGQIILRMNEDNWGWNTPAGALRKLRRINFLTDVNIDDKKKVLEIGCGTGTFTGALAKKFPNLTAIDISDSLLDVAKGKFPEVKFVNTDAHQTTFQRESFNYIAGCSVLHHLNWEIALREFRRLLKPGGQVRFSEPNLLNPQIYLQKKWPWLKNKMGDSPDESAFTPAQIKSVLKNLDYKNIHVEPYEFLHPSTPKILIPLIMNLETHIEKTFLKNIAGSILISAEL